MDILYESTNYSNNFVLDKYRDNDLVLKFKLPNNKFKYCKISSIKVSVFNQYDDLTLMVDGSAEFATNSTNILRTFNLIHLSEHDLGVINIAPVIIDKSFQDITINLKIRFPPNSKVLYKYSESNLSEIYGTLVSEESENIDHMAELYIKNNKKNNNKSMEKTFNVKTKTSFLTSDQIKNLHQQVIEKTDLPIPRIEFENVIAKLNMNDYKKQKSKQYRGSQQSDSKDILDSFDLDAFINDLVNNLSTVNTPEATPVPTPVTTIVSTPVPTMPTNNNVIYTTSTPLPTTKPPYNPSTKQPTQQPTMPTTKETKSNGMMWIVIILFVVGLLFFVGNDHKDKIKEFFNKK